MIIEEKLLQNFIKKIPIKLSTNNEIQLKCAITMLSVFNFFFLWQYQVRGQVEMNL